jgi:lysophospholipase L1-like esterase
MSDIKDRTSVKTELKPDDWLAGQENSAGLGVEFRAQLADFGIVKFSSLAARLTATANNGRPWQCHIATADYNIQCLSNGDSWFSFGSSADIAHRPAAATLGKGQWQVGDKVFVSDSIRWSKVTTTLTEFNPSQLSGLQLWLDASDTLLKADLSAAVLTTDTVTYWPDKSGNSRGPTVSGTPKVGEINGVKAVQFNGDSLFVTPAFIDTAYNTSGFTLFVVAKHNTDTVPAAQCIAGFTAPFVAIQADTPRLSSGALTGLTGFAPSLDRGTIDGVYMLGWDGGTNAIYGLNGAISCSASGACTASDIAMRKAVTGGITFATAPGNALKIGALGVGQYNWNGLEGEVILYNRLVTDAEAAQISGYLQTKWGYDKPLLTCIGGSLTSGQESTGGVTQSQISGTSNWPNQFKALAGGESAIRVRTDAVPGRQIKQILALSAGSRLYRSLFNPSSSKKQAATVFIAGNDIATLSVGSGAYEYYRDLCLDLKNTGYEVIAGTIIKQGVTPDAGFEAFRNDFNTKLRANYRQFADKLVDFDTILNLTNPLNTTYFAADKIHLTDAGYALVAAAVFAVY